MTIYNEKVFNSIELFCSVLKEQGVWKVVCAVIDERRPLHTVEETIEVVPVKQLEVIAYHNSVIFKYKHNSEQFDVVIAFLDEQGFETKVVNRNIT